MPRAPFQVLVLPYSILTDGAIAYAIFKRIAATGGFWQGIAGAGEDDETPLAAAQREAFEEAGIADDRPYTRLDTCCSVPTSAFDSGAWSGALLVIPEYCFGVHVKDERLQLSHEHERYQWLSYSDACNRLMWDSNRTALWELDCRLRQSRGAIGSAEIEESLSATESCTATTQVLVSDEER